jgi:hypothetical protein
MRSGLIDAGLGPAHLEAQFFELPHQGGFLTDISEKLACTFIGMTSFSDLP